MLHKLERHEWLLFVNNIVIIISIPSLHPPTFHEEEKATSKAPFNKRMMRKALEFCGPDGIKMKSVFQKMEEVRKLRDKQA